MDAIEAIRSRRSVRNFQARPVDREALRTIVNAGRLAPTARNTQPWEFVVVTDASTRRKLADLADHGKFLAEAPACVVLMCKDTKYYLEDGSAAATSMLIAATALGLGGCWVAGDKKAYADKIVSMCGGMADMKLVAMLALGYPEEVGDPTKRPLDEVMHWEQF